jgi:Fur family ferric uptake transcriptional regulator
MKKETQNIASKRLSEYLSEKKLRATSQREIILKTFIDLGMHPTAEELYESLKKFDASIGHATVYRALRLFVDAGIARELNFNDGSVRYESIAGKEPHDHLVCVKCGTSLEFTDSRIKSIQDETASKYGYTLKNRSHILFGTCSKCTK